jgi:hypothetical protein
MLVETIYSFAFCLLQLLALIIRQRSTFHIKEEAAFIAMISGNIMAKISTAIAYKVLKIMRIKHG